MTFQYVAPYNMYKRAFLPKNIVDIIISSIFIQYYIQKYILSSGFHILEKWLDYAEEKSYSQLFPILVAFQK